MFVEQKLDLEDDNVFVRIGNLLVPNNNYVKFEEWLMPILDKLLEEQNKNGVVWTPSKIIHRLLILIFLKSFLAREHRTFVKGCSFLHSLIFLAREHKTFVTGWDLRSTTSLPSTTGLQSEFCEKLVL